MVWTAERITPRSISELASKNIKLQSAKYTVKGRAIPFFQFIMVSNQHELEKIPEYSACLPFS